MTLSFTLIRTITLSEILLRQFSHFVEHALLGVFCYHKSMKKYKTLEEFFDDLDDDKSLQVKALRDLILSTEPELEEHIKWNAPSYVLNGEDRITFNLMNKQGVVKLVLHMGASRKEDKNGVPIMQDESGLIEWSSDIRGMITFMSIRDVNSNAIALKKVINDWLSIPVAM